MSGSQSKGTVNSEKVSAPLYFRGDNRLPDQIFKEGFVTAGKPNTIRHVNESTNAVKPDLTIEQWEKMSVRNTVYHGVIDADPKYSISMSRNLKSAAVFPEHGDKTYIYIIKIPDAVTTRAKPSMLISNQVVIHELHDQQIAQILDMYMKDPNIDSGFLGDVLRQYETFANQIPSKYIIGCIECERGELIPETDDTIVHTNIGSVSVLEHDQKPIMMVPIDRKFKPIRIYANINYCNPEERKKVIKQFEEKY